MIIIISTLSEDISCVFELNSCAWDFLGGFTLSHTMLAFIHPHGNNIIVILLVMMRLIEENYDAEIC